MEQTLTSMYLLGIVILFVVTSSSIGLLLAFGITKWVRHSWKVSEVCMDSGLVQSNHSRAIDVLNSAVDIGNGWKSVDVPIHTEQSSNMRRRKGDS
jgi:hypothetical protein